VTCRATIAPIFTRADAALPANLAAFGPATAVFMLGGDQTVAMAALAATPAEEELTRLHARGGVVGGTSAGGGMLSYTLLGGYNPNVGAANSLRPGAVDLWDTPDRRGLCFGEAGVVFDQHFFQRGRLGRLLSALTVAGAPPVGVGIDAYTGLVVSDGALHDVFGLYTVAVLDVATYRVTPPAGRALPSLPPLAARASATATPLRPAQGDGAGPTGGPPAVSGDEVLDLRNVLVHLLAPGDASYAIAARQHSAAAPPKQLQRSFDALTLPRGAGALLLAGDLAGSLTGSPVLARFAGLTGKASPRILIIADGYPSAASARRAADKYGAALASLGAAPTVYAPAEGGSGPPDLTGVDAILVTGRDQSRLALAALRPWLRDAWWSGKPLLLDNAWAAAAGVLYSAHGPTPKEGEAAEFATQRSFRAGETQLVPGLGLVDAMFEPQVLADNRWGRLFSLGYRRPERVVFGLNRDSALELTAAGPRALGANAVLALDLRLARLATGANGAFGIANGLLDVFAPGRPIAPSPAASLR
jgi:cyanophycinase